LSGRELGGMWEGTKGARRKYIDRRRIIKRIVGSEL
jgi:hypothetical protein